MTTVIGVQQDDKAILIADNQITDGSRPLKHPNHRKITENGKILIARSGDVGICDIIQYVWIVPQPTTPDKKDYFKFMVSKFVPSLRSCLKEHDYFSLKGENKDDYSFTLLVAVGGFIFEVGDDFSVSMSEDGIYGVGSGSDYAIGAIKAGASLERAMEIAEELDVNTSGPFLIKEQYK
jgi:ATP-dependent protease HslVU (ClpYQ) peptidase subunit